MSQRIIAASLSKRYLLGRPQRPSLLPARRSRAGKGKPARVREIWALSDVSFDADAGTIVGVIGPNGAGKTTLLKVLSRTTLPTSGTALLRGRVVPLLELGAGFNRDVSGRQGIYMKAALLGIPRGIVDRRLDDIVEFAGLEEQIDMPLKKLSSGMYVRLAFATAINLEPDILLADEVLAVGDIGFQERCLAKVESTGRAGATVLFVSHDMDAIRRLCDRVLWLDRGHLVQDGPTEDVVAAYEASQLDLFGEAVRAPSEASEHCEILAVRLVAESGSEIGAARTSEPCAVQIVYRTSEHKTSIRCVLAISTGEVVAFRTALPRPAVHKRPDTYHATARIPGGLLSDVVYHVKVGLQGRRANGDEFSLVAHDALVFRVYESEESIRQRGTFDGSLAGIVRPSVEWEIANGAPVVFRSKDDPAAQGKGKATVK